MVLQKMRKDKTVLIDSDAFIAFIKENDSNHNKAKKIFKQLERKNINFITSNYVFAETVTVISQRIGHKTALEFIENVRSSKSLIATRWVDEHLEEMAINIFKSQISKNVSFVDCANMALMNYYNLSAIFSFDAIYKKQGFKIASDL